MDVAFLSVKMGFSEYMMVLDVEEKPFHIRGVPAFGVLDVLFDPICPNPKRLPEFAKMYYRCRWLVTI